VRDEARRAVRRGSTRGGSDSPGPSPATRADGGARAERSEPSRRRGATRDTDELRQTLTRSVGAERAARLARRVEQAAEAFADELDDDAVRLLRPIAREAPDVLAVRELLGLALYRLGRWKAAVVELEAVRAQTASTEQHPVLADCYRALRRWQDVEDLWEELREVSPSAELVTEGRIVAAGALADRGDLPAAIALLSRGWAMPGRAKEHHLRRAYALADLYERAGDLPRARELFGWVAELAPELGDARRRALALR
jgi:tetratricopeptide (TPR) repeat protein